MCLVCVCVCCVCVYFILHNIIQRGASLLDEMAAEFAAEEAEGRCVCV